jgi:hypothetical protein
MNQRKERIERITRVEREYRTGELAIGSLRTVVARDSGFLSRHDLQTSDLRNLGENFEATYFLRVFAEFEAALREVWAQTIRRRTVPKTEDLLNAIASRQSLPSALLENAHKVRKFRNALIHEGGEVPATVSIATARRNLCQFLGRMPPF